MKLKGFTLIELLVVISVIAILSTLTVVYLETARMSARDARRMSDIKQIQLALKMYYNDTGIYPTTVSAGASIANGGTNYLLTVPSNPAPRADNSCPDQDYQYKQLESGQGYSLAFCLGDKTDDLEAGMHSATSNGILNCPTGYIAVPGSSTFNTNDFCVMQYEAKCADKSDLTTGLPSNQDFNTYNSQDCTNGNNKTIVSVASGVPVTNISQTTAATYCQSIGGHLMTNAEWMTIARNLEQTVSNWPDGSVGGGYVYQGNYSDNQAEDGTSSYGGCGDESCKRTLTLSNGQTIWDLSGNVSEILNDSCSYGSGVGYYEPFNGGYVEWNEGSLADYELAAAGPSTNGYTSAQKIGMYEGCFSKDQRIRGVFIRGGDASGYAGIFNLDLVNTLDSSANSHFGFRCVK